MLGPHFLLMGACQAHPAAIDLPDVHPGRGGHVRRKQVPDILLQDKGLPLYNQKAPQKSVGTLQQLCALLASAEASDKLQISGNRKSYSA